MCVSSCVTTICAQSFVFRSADSETGGDAKITMRFDGTGVADPFERSTSSEMTMSIGPRGGWNSRESCAYAYSAPEAMRRASGSVLGLKWT